MPALDQELIDQIARFGKEVIWPHAKDDDENEFYRPEVFAGLTELGLTGIPVSDQYDGAGMGYQEFCDVLEELAKWSVPHAITLSVSTMVQGILQQFGNDQQKAKFIPPLSAGGEVGAFCLSESHSGSDAAALKTTAKKTDGGYILNGTKMWISSAGVASTYIVMARTGGPGSRGISSFIVPAQSKGLTVGKKEEKMGWRASPTREVILENCFVPSENLLSEEGKGFGIAMAALDRGRITIGAIATGLAQRALDESGKYSLERKQFEQSIYDFQGIQFMLADMATETMASRLLVQRAAQAFDNSRPDPKIASMAKMKATDTAMSVTTDAVQILGGVGYTREYPLERFMRDAKVLQIVEGTNQIQRVVIARELKRSWQT